MTNLLISIILSFPTITWFPGRVGCQDLMYINEYEKKTTKQDLATIERAKNQCPVLYKRSPCVLDVTKIKINDYTVTCTKRGR